VLHLRGHGAPVADAEVADAQRAATSGELPEAVPAVLDVMEPGLGQDGELVEAVLAQTEVLLRRP
jgi:fructuronate reductase